MVRKKKKREIPRIQVASLETDTRIFEMVYKDELPAFQVWNKKDECLEFCSEFLTSKPTPRIYVPIGDKESSKDHFKRVFRICPKYSPNPDTMLPEVIEILRRAKAERAHEAAMCSCFIPGMGQMIKGDDTKGRIILVAGTATFATTLASWIITLDKRYDYLALGPSETEKMDNAYNTYNTWQRTSIVSSVLFLGIYFYSIYDAMFTNTSISRNIQKSEAKFSVTCNADQIGLVYKVILLR